MNLPSSFTFLARPSLAFRHSRRPRRCRDDARTFTTRANPSSSYSENDDDENDIATEFARFVGADPKFSAPPPASPSPLLSPSSVARAVCSALQRPDVPERGSGLRTAFDFTLPSDVGPGAPLFSPPRRARSWNAREIFFPLDDFAQDSLLVTRSNRSSPPAGSLLVDCDSWELLGDLAFTGRGSQGVGGGGGGGSGGDPARAAQAVSVVVGASKEDVDNDNSDDGGGGEKTSSSSSSSSSNPPKKKTVTILLSRVDAPGPWKGCWLVYGVRAGNYSL